MVQQLHARLTYANVMSSIGVFIALGGTSAYAANSIFSEDIVDGQVKTPDLGTLAVTNGKLGENAVGSGKVLDNHLTGDDVKDDSLKGADIDEGSLVGGPGSPSGAAGGDLVGSYPNPLIGSNAVGSNEILDRSIGARDLKTTTYVSEVEPVPPGGVPVSGVSASCPTGSLAIHGGAYWEYPSGQLSTADNSGNYFLADGTNRGQAEQDLTAFARCLPY